MEDQKIIEKLKSLVVLDKKETAEQAFLRFKEAVNFMVDNYEAKEWEWCRDYFKNLPVYQEKVTIEQLESEEKRLNFKLPQSYKDFVLKFGLIGYGETERLMIFPFRRLSEYLKDDCELDDDVINDCYEGDIHPDNLIIFSCGDEGLQKEFYHCFQSDGTVYDVCEEELGYPRDTHSTFDEYLQWATNTFIIVMLESEFEYNDFENWDEFY